MKRLDELKKALTVEFCDIEFSFHGKDCGVEPIVENSILHGVRYREKGYIKIKIYRSATAPKVIVSVVDTGIGMTREELQMQRENMKEYNPNHVGLANVNCRLKLYYGEEAQLHIYSKKNLGTVIRFSLPAE